MPIIDTTGLEPFADLLKEIYGDLAKPGVAQVGIALATVIGLLNTCLSPIKFLNEKTELNRQNNLKQLAKRFSEIPPEKIVEAPPEIAVPITEKLIYVSNDELRNLYIELLAKASTIDLNEFAHPSFINLINSLSPDEALLLKYFKENPSISPPYFFETHIRKSEAFAHYLLDDKRRQTGFPYTPEKIVGLQFPNNLSGYLENFEGLGIIYMTESNSAQINMFKDIEQTINRSLDRAGVQVQRLSLLSYSRLNEQRQSLYVTNYGKLFLNAVIEQPKT